MTKTAAPPLDPVDLEILAVLLVGAALGLSRIKRYEPDNSSCAPRKAAQFTGAAIWG